MCDEEENGIVYNITNAVNFASFDAASNPEAAVYANSYNSIRRTNILLANKKYMNFPSKNKLVAEAQFLRAFYYSELIKRYGGVPIVTKPDSANVAYSQEALEEYKKSLKRASYADCVTFIVQQLDSAAAVLPWFPAVDNDRGRATAAACVALKAKVLLFAASKLFNNPQPAASGPGSMTDPLIGYTSYDKNRWKLAADACREFFTKNAANANWYSLYPNYYALFTESRDAANRELIWYRQGSDGYDVNFRPLGRLGGFGNNQATLNQIDKYEMTNGRSINEAGSGYNEQQWWVNRDPRLAQTFVRNGDTWRGVNIEFWQPSAGQVAGGDWSGNMLTGVFFRKFQRTDANTGVQKWHYLRLADIYMMLAEAENEMNGPTAEVYNALNAVRSRPTVTMPGVTPGLSQDQMRDKIRNERAVEFVLEAQRYFDVRRWMIAEVTDNAPIQGFRVTKNGTTITHTRYTLETRKFLNRMYLYPFSLAEVNKGADIKQNPGY
jgi:hypothetical protein